MSISSSKIVSSISSGQASKRRQDLNLIYKDTQISPLNMSNHTIAPISLARC